MRPNNGLNPFIRKSGNQTAQKHLFLGTRVDSGEAADYHDANKSGSSHGLQNNVALPGYGERRSTRKSYSIETRYLVLPG